MFIYKIEFPNDKVYIGQTCDLQGRLWGHRSAAKNGSSIRLYNAIRKHLGQSLELIVIDEASSQEELDKKEIDWISKFDSTNPEKGYNLLSGGQGGHIYNKMSEAQRSASKEKQKRSRAKTMEGRLPPMSLKAIAERNNCTLEEAHKLTPNYGKERSDFVKRRASETHKGKKVSKEVIRKQIVSNAKFNYIIQNTKTREEFTTINLYQWCKDKKLPYGPLSRKANDPSVNSYKLKEWTVKKVPR